MGKKYLASPVALREIYHTDGLACRWKEDNRSGSNSGNVFAKASHCWSNLEIKLKKEECENRSIEVQKNPGVIIEVIGNYLINLRHILVVCTVRIVNVVTEGSLPGALYYV